MKRLQQALLGLGFTLLAAACAEGGGGAVTPTPTPRLGETPKAQVLNVALGGEDFAVGTNRIPIFLFNFDGEPIEDAKAEASFGPIVEDKVTVVAKAEAAYRRVLSEYTHTHADGKVETHTAGKGFYVVDRATFDKPGSWATQVRITLPSGEMLSGVAAFDVKERPATPALGAQVPVTRNPTARDVANIADIDSSMPPRPEMHQISVAEALERHRPFVVVFASPSFCTSKLCGPVTDEVAALQEKYRDRIEFIHIEPYEMGPLRNQGAFRVTAHTKEWGLPSEPWTFVVDGQGRLFAKFEGLAARQEIDAAVQGMLGIAESSATGGPR